jgi:hypothetical protein
LIVVKPLGPRVAHVVRMAPIPHLVTIFALFFALLFVVVGSGRHWR